MEEAYYAKYKTGKTGIAVSGVVIIALFVIILFSIVFGFSDLTPFAVIGLVFAIGAGFISLKGYREIVLYKNRMEVVGVIRGVIAQIDYRDVKSIGFIRGHTEYIHSRNLSNGYTDSVEVSELVILLKNGDRQIFGDDDFDNLHEVCAYIQEKTGLP